MRRGTVQRCQGVLAPLLFAVLAAGPAQAAPAAPSPPVAKPAQQPAQPPQRALAVGVPAARALAGMPTAPTVSPQLAAAQAAAKALKDKVAALQVATESAVEHYNEVAAQLQRAQAAHAAATRALAAARATMVTADRIADSRLREIYIAGGPPGILEWTFSTPPGMDLFHSFDDRRFFAAQDRQRFAAAAAATAAATAAERAQAATLATQQRLTRQAAAARAAVQQRLAAEQQLLASATAGVQAILAAEQQAQQREAARLAALVRSASRRLGPGVALLGGTTSPADGPLPPVLRRVLAAGEAELGKPYQWGATGPSAYDCSGFVQQVFAAAGVTLPRTSRQQWYAGTHPANSTMQPGDLLFWADGSDPATIHHVAIYLGSGYMMAAPHTGAVVQVQPVYTSGFFGVTRVAALAAPPAAAKR